MNNNNLLNGGANHVNPLVDDERELMDISVACVFDLLKDIGVVSDAPMLLARFKEFIRNGITNSSHGVYTAVIALLTKCAHDKMRESNIKHNAINNSSSYMSFPSSSIAHQLHSASERSITPDPSLQPAGVSSDNVMTNNIYQTKRQSQNKSTSVSKQTNRKKREFNGNHEVDGIFSATKKRSSSNSNKMNNDSSTAAVSSVQSNSVVAEGGDNNGNNNGSKRHGFVNHSSGGTSANNTNFRSGLASVYELLKDQKYPNAENLLSNWAIINWQILTIHNEMPVSKQGRPKTDQIFSTLLRWCGLISSVVSFLENGANFRIGSIGYSDLMKDCCDLIEDMIMSSNPSDSSYCVHFKQKAEDARNFAIAMFDSNLSAANVRPGCEKEYANLRTYAFKLIAEEDYLTVISTHPLCHYILARTFKKDNLTRIIQEEASIAKLDYIFNGLEHVVLMDSSAMELVISTDYELSVSNDTSVVIRNIETSEVILNTTPIKTRQGMKNYLLSSGEKFSTVGPGNANAGVAPSSSNSNASPASSLSPSTVYAPSSSHYASNGNINMQNHTAISSSPHHEQTHDVSYHDDILVSSPAEVHNASQSAYDFSSSYPHVASLSHTDDHEQHPPHHDNHEMSNNVHGEYDSLNHNNVNGHCNSDGNSITLQHHVDSSDNFVSHDNDDIPPHESMSTDDEDDNLDEQEIRQSLSDMETPHEESVLSSTTNHHSQYEAVMNSQQDVEPKHTGSVTELASNKNSCSEPNIIPSSNNDNQCLRNPSDSKFQQFNATTLKVVCKPLVTGTMKDLRSDKLVSASYNSPSVISKHPPKKALFGRGTKNE